MYELGFDKRHKELITPVMMNIFPSILQWQCICFMVFIVIPNLTNQANAQLGKVKKVFRTSELLETESGYLPETASPKENDAAPFLCEYSQVQDSVCGSFRAECHGVFHPEHFESCSNESALVTPIYDVSRKRYVLFINETLASIILKSKKEKYSCYYQKISRSRRHDSYKK